MRITESQIRRIIADEAKKLKRGRKINESQASAEELLHNAMQEYVDQMNAAGFGYEQICEMMQNSVSGFCETFLEELEPQDRDPEHMLGRGRRY
jgi:hypothetical protein